MTTAKNILKKTELKQYIETTTLKFTVNYEFINLIKNFIKKNNFKIINETYTDNINFNIEIPVNKKDMVINNLKNITSDNMFF
jgi:putative IMPACT (imprinted ancient) family translation regulator